MSVTTCPRCVRESADGLLCSRCRSDAHKALRRIAAHYGDLYAKPVRGGSTTGSGFGSRAPMADRRVEIAAYVRNQLSTWMRDLDMGDIGGIADEPTVWALWLATRTQRLVSHAAGNEAVDEFVYCADLVTRAIDTRLTRTGCGVCPTCGAEVWAIGDDQTGICRRCQDAGVEAAPMPVISARRDLWARLEREPMPRRVLMEALPMFGLHVKPATFRQWVHRGVLVHVDEVDGARRYLLADVRTLADAAA